MTAGEAGGAYAASPASADTGDERSLGDIVGDVVQDLSTLVRQELDLAKTELKEEAGRAGKGAGLLGGAALSALLLLLFLSLALTWLLDNWMPVELAALITALIWGVAAGAMAAAGRSQLKKTNPQLPKTQQSVKEDVAWASAQRN